MNNRPWIIFCLFILSTHSVQLNLILNGDFSYNLCPQNHCTWKTNTYAETDVYGWLPDPQISIATGQIYNSILGKQKVLQISQNKNSCVKQVFGSLNQGSYKLNLEYTSYQNKQNSQNAPFNVHFNGKLLKTISAQSSQLQSQSIDVKLDSFSTNVQLKFCGTSTSDTNIFGAILTKVQFWGQGKGYLRKEDPILETYHQIPLRQRSARLLQTSVTPTPTITSTTGSGSTSSSISTVSTWVEKPALSNLSFDLVVNSQWKSNSACPQALTSKSSWNERPSSIQTTDIISEGWSTNSNCATQSQPSTAAQKSFTVQKTLTKTQSQNVLLTDTLASASSLWTEKPQNSMLELSGNSGWSSNSDCKKEDGSSVKESSLWTENPSNLKQDSTANSGWASNSDCKQPADNQVINPEQIKASPTPLSLINTVLSTPSDSWVEKKVQGLTPSTNLAESTFKSDSNCKDTTEGSTAPQWTSKPSTLGSDQPVDPNASWDSNSDCVEDPKAPAKTSEQKPIIHTQPTLEDLLPPSLPQRIDQIPQIPIISNIITQKPTTVDQPKLTLESLMTPNLLSNTLKAPETPNVITQKPTIQNQPKVTAQGIVSPTPKLAQNMQVVSKTPQTKRPQLIASSGTPTDIKLVDLENSAPDFITDKSVLSQNGGTSQNIIPQVSDDAHSYLSESAASAPIQPSTISSIKPPTVENHIVEELIQKPSMSFQNLINNGDFQTYKCAFPPCLINQMIPGSSLHSWIAEPFIQIGKINQYNPSLKASADNIGAHLGFSTKNSCIKQSLKTVTTNYYELSFDYAPVVPRSSDFVSEAFFIVKFNGKNVKNVLCLDKLSHKQSIVVKGMKGENVIEFCAFGSSNENPHGAIIDNVSLTLKPNTETLKTDFIVNGDFQTNQCYSKNCLWSHGNFNSKYLPGWLPQSDIEIGKGNLYNVHAGISTVAELSPNSNSCIMQIIENCERGSFKLAFSWAARQSEALHDSVFQVKLNNQVVQSYIPNSYALHRESLVLNLNEGRNELKFCSFGMNNDKGAVIDDVSMFLIDSCSKNI